MKIRCLVLDDNPDIIALLQEILKPRGYDVSSYKSPVLCPIYQNKDSCNQKERCREIGIFDNMMPGMTGLGFIELQLKKGCRCIRGNTAIMSGAFTEEELIKAKKLGCKIFTKPFNLEELEGWLDECEKRISKKEKISP